MSVKLIWITPDAEQLIGDMARVSNSSAQPGDDCTKLISYLLNHHHFSPFEMVSCCLEIITQRDIGRQIIRHRSFHFQEFSQRYAEVDQVEPSLREARLQDPKNRQNSLSIKDESLQKHWEELQRLTWRMATNTYKEALKCGIAKEQARALLPEGLTNTRMYMSGTIRDWLHYLEVRCAPGTQQEHREVAFKVLGVLEESCPGIFKAARQAGFNLGTEQSQ